MFGLKIEDRVATKLAVKAALRQWPAALDGVETPCPFCATVHHQLQIVQDGPGVSRLEMQLPDSPRFLAEWIRPLQHVREVGSSDLVGEGVAPPPVAFIGAVFRGILRSIRASLVRLNVRRLMARDDSCLVPCSRLAGRISTASAWRVREANACRECEGTFLTSLDHCECESCECESC